MSGISYELPFGRSKKYGKDLSGVAGQLASGWHVSGILSLHSGTPFDVRQADNRSRNGAVFFSDRPNLSTGSCRVFGSPAGWFDVTAFVPAGPGFYGTSPRNACRGPGFKNLDLSAQKDFTVSERIKLHFQCDFFNMANHPNFASPENIGNPNGLGGGDAAFAGTQRLAIASAGRIFNTVNSAREIQFALKMSF